MPLTTESDLQGVYVCTRADVTPAARAAYIVRVRTVEWPQREGFLAFLEERRKAKGYKNVTALAEAAGVSHTTLSSWRTGRQRPSLAKLQDLADVLGVPAHVLAEKAGVVDPTRFGQAAPPAVGDVEELAKIVQLILDDPALSDEDREYFIGRAREDWEREQDAAEERARDRTITRIEEWKRARSA